MKKIIEVEKLQEVLNEMGEMPVKIAFNAVSKLLVLIEQSPNFEEDKVKGEDKSIEII